MAPLTWKEFTFLMVIYLLVLAVFIVLVRETDDYQDNKRHDTTPLPAECSGVCA